MRPTFVIPVHGTWGLKDKSPWWKLNSNFEKFCRINNIFFYGGHDSFVWSGRIDGFNFGFKDNHYDWLTAGLSLKYYLKEVPYDDRNLILHSHAWPVFLYSGAKVRNVITVGSPMRGDILNLAINARDSKLFNYHLHIYDMLFDRIAFLGQIGDGRWFGSRHCDTATDNKKLKGIGHTKILTDPEHIGKWDSEGWFDVLRLRFKND